jgi:hypothetical protein
VLHKNKSKNILESRNTRKMGGENRQNATTFYGDATLPAQSDNRTIEDW